MLRQPNLSKQTHAAAAVRPPTADRVLGALLILLQLGVLAFLSGARLFPFVMGGLTLWGLFTRIRMKVNPTPQNLIYALMAIAFLLHYMFAPFALPIDSQFIRSSLAHSLARLLISVQVLQLFLAHESGRLPIWLGACGAVTLAFATNLRVPEAMHDQLLALVAAFMAFFSLYGSRARQAVNTLSPFAWTRWLAMTVALLLAVLLGTGAAWALQKHERDIEWFLAEYLGYSGRTTRTGFNPSGRLESVTAWRAEGGETAVLRVFADEAPGYLRGMVFEKYRGSNRDTSYTPWLASEKSRLLMPAVAPRDHPKLRPGDRVFKVADGDTPFTRVLDVWPADAAPLRLFTPLGTQTLAVRGDDARIDRHNVVTFADRATAAPYLVTAIPTDSGGMDRAHQDAAEVDEELLTSFDVAIDESVQQLATQLFDGCHTTRQKIDAVTSYFELNYEYRLGINVPHRMDPVTYFLTQQPAAHCEYFATGTAILLRLGHVPCRYVIGYVAAEWNELGNFWMARQKDAHAWVEAFDSDAGEWVIVESTPAAGVPQPREPGLSTQLVESLRHRISIWQMRLREYGLITVWTTVAELAWSIPGLIILMGGLAVALLRYRPDGRVWRERKTVPESIRQMHQVLARLDRQVARQGLLRAPQETLSSFARRVRKANSDPRWKTAAAECYERYVDLRYRGEVGADVVQQLLQAVTQIPRGSRSPAGRPDDAASSNVVATGL